jgi:hypothetical protein
MELTPVDTIDPTPFLYDTTCWYDGGESTYSNLFIPPLDVQKVCSELEAMKETK